MSLLRQIMQRLGDRVRRASDDTPAGAVPGSDPARLEPDFADRLRECSDGMLLYEWEWLERRLAQVGLADEEHAGLRQALALLRTEFQARTLSPVRPPGPLLPDRHAWQVEDPEIRRLWNFH